MPEYTLESLAVRLAEVERALAELQARVTNPSPGDVALLAAQSEAAGRAGWDDPIMDEYDRYDEVMRSQNRDPR